MSWNGQKKPDCIRDSNDRGAVNEPWIENSILVSEPFDFAAVDLPRPTSFDGAFWDVLNKGIARKVHETVIGLFHLFLTLPPEQQKAFVLRVAHKMSFREIGGILDVTHPTARKLYEQASGRLAAFSTGKDRSDCTAGRCRGTSSAPLPRPQKVKALD